MPCTDDGWARERNERLKCEACKKLSREEIEEMEMLEWYVGHLIQDLKDLICRPQDAYWNSRRQLAISELERMFKIEEE